MGMSSTAVFTLFIVACLVSISTPLQFVASTHGELHWALRSAKAGDEILLPNVEIQWQNESFRSYAHGTSDNPITVRGLGSNSVLKRNQGEKTLYGPPEPKKFFEVQHSYWKFDNFRFTGYYDSALYIHPSVEGVDIRNVAFEHLGFDQTMSYGASVVSFGRSVGIDNCTFLVKEVGVYVHEGSNPTQIKEIWVTNSYFQPLEDSIARAGAVFLYAADILVANNTFSSENGLFWKHFVDVAFGRGVIKDNVGHRARSDGFDVYGLRHINQEYQFNGNHCDLQSNTWCIHVINDFSYNTTTINDNNTFENARGLTNKPQN